MKKVILNVIICFAIIIFITPKLNTVVFADELDYKENIEKLVAFGVVSHNQFEYDKAISRGDFTALAVKISKDYNLYKNSTDTLPFSDVLSSDSNYEYISSAYNLGYIRSAQMFYPDNPITYLEAIIILERVLGYEPLAELADSDYIHYAHEANIDIAATAVEGTIKSQDAARLLIKALEAYPIKPDKNTGTNTVYKKSDKNLLQLNFDINYISVIVTKNEITDLYVPYSEIGENQIMVNDRILNSGTTNSYDYLGVYSDIYYKSSKDENEEEIVYIGENKKNSGIERVNYRDIIHADLSQVKYMDEEKQKTMKLSKTVKVIYNGKFVPISLDVIDVAYGDYVFVDNNGDGTADVVKIMEYTPYQIQSISKEKQSISTTDGVEIFLDKEESNTCIRIIKNNELADFEALTVGAVIMYGESSNTGVKLKSVLASTETVSGNVSELGEKIKIENVSYYYNQHLSKSLQSGIVGSFYLDSYGEISCFDYEIRNVFGYLKRMYLSDSEDIVYLRIFSEKGRWVTLPMADKVIYNHSGRKTQFEIANILGGYGSECHGLIEYKVNNDGKIIELSTPKQFTPYSPEENEAIENNTFRFLEGGVKTYNLDAVVMGDSIALSSGTVLFSVPTDVENADEDEYEIVSLSLLSDGKDYTIDAYNGDQSRLCEVLVIYDIPSFINSGGKMASLIVFNDIVDVCLNDEPQKAISGYMSGSEIMLALGETEEIKAQALLLKRGDIIQTSFDRAGKINGIDKVYIHSDLEIITGLTNTFQSKFSYVMGQVISINLSEGICLIKYADDGYGIMSHKTGVQGVYIYEHDKKPHIKKVDTSDIAIGDYIFCSMKYACAKDIIIYRQ